MYLCRHARPSCVDIRTHTGVSVVVERVAGLTQTLEAADGVTTAAIGADAPLGATLVDVYERHRNTPQCQLNVNTVQ